MFVKGKEWWGHIDGITPKSTYPTKQDQWEIHNASWHHELDRMLNRPLF